MCAKLRKGTRAPRGARVFCVCVCMQEFHMRVSEIRAIEKGIIGEGHRARFESAGQR